MSLMMIFELYILQSGMAVLQSMSWQYCRVCHGCTAECVMTEVLDPGPS